MTRKLETRSSSRLEVRAADGGLRTVAGVAMPYNQITQRSDFLYGDYYEVVLPGAFNQCLRDPELDVPVNTCHLEDEMLPIARFRAGRQNNTLSVSDDENELSFSMQPANTTAGRDLVELIGRGDVDGVSVGMYVLDDDWTTTYNGLPLRKVSNAYLDHISFVTRQQYPTATAELRGKKAKAEQEEKIDLEIREKFLALEREKIQREISA